jgi:microcystin-dependent protein
MSDPFLAEIRMFAGNFAPRGWATCDGQVLPISQNTALFSLLGTTYGGNGRTTFALPNLQGTAPLHPGQGPGLTPRDLGESGGEPSVSLLVSEMASHNHSAQATAVHATAVAPAGQTWAAAPSRGESLYSDASSSAVAMSPVAFLPSGGSQPHNNMPPYLAVTFIIALQGVFPARQ